MLLQIFASILLEKHEFGIYQNEEKEKAVNKLTQIDEENKQEIVSQKLPTIKRVLYKNHRKLMKNILKNKSKEKRLENSKFKRYNNLGREEINSALPSIHQGKNIFLIT